MPTNNGGIVVARAIFGGYNVTLTFARVNGVADDLAQFLEDNWEAGQSDPVVSMLETVYNTDGTVNTYNYINGTILPKDGGSFKGVSEVTGTYDFFFPQRQSVGAANCTHSRQPGALMLRKFALVFGAIALATAMTVGLASIPRMVRASGTPTPWTFTEKITVNTSNTAVQNAILGDVQGYLQGIVNSPALAVASPTVTISPSASPYTNQVTASYVITFGAQDLQTAQVTINNITKLLQGLVLNPQISVVVPPAQYAAIAASPELFRLHLDASAGTRAERVPLQRRVHRHRCAQRGVRG